MKPRTYAMDLVAGRITLDDVPAEFRTMVACLAECHTGLCEWWADYVLEGRDKAERRTRLSNVPGKLQAHVERRAREKYRVRN
jgi:hypothetical protein